MKKDWQTKNPSTGLRADPSAGLRVDPSAWLMVKLGEVCDFQNGFAFKSKLFSQSGLPILRISNIQQDKISYNRLVFFNQINYNINFEKYKVKKGDLVIAMSGATTGKLAISNTDEIFYLNQRVGKFKPKKELLKEFLYYFLTTKIEENLKISQGAAQPNLSTIQIKNFEIPLPPISEQRRIVGILDGVFENIEKAKEDTEKNLKNAKELFENYSNILYQKLLTEHNADILDNLATLVRGPFGGSLTKSMFVKKGYAVYEQRNAIGNFTDSFRYFINDKKYKEMKRFAVKLGDILMSCSGTIGKFTTISENKIDGIINQALLKITSNINKIDRKYLLFILKNFIQDGEKHSKGAAIKNIIAVKELKKIKIPLFNKTEQKQIVGRLDALSGEVKKLEKTYQQKLNNLEELKKSILKQAFNGEL